MVQHEENRRQQQEREGTLIVQEEGEGERPATSEEHQALMEAIQHEIMQELQMELLREHLQLQQVRRPSPPPPPPMQTRQRRRQRRGGGGTRRRTGGVGSREGDTMSHNDHTPHLEDDE